MDALSEESVTWEVNRLVTLTKTLDSEPSLHFVLDHKTLRREQGSGPTLLKRCLLYSARTIVLTPPASYAVPVGDISPTRSTGWYDRPDHSILSKSNIGPADLESASDLIVAIPESITKRMEDWEDDDFSVDEIPVFDFRSAYKKTDSLDVALADPFLNAQLTEHIETLRLRLVNLWLPTVSGVSAPDLLKIRMDEQEAFARMHSALRQFVLKLSGLGPEPKLKELMQEVDLNVRKLDEKFVELKRRHRRSLAEASVGVAIVGMLLMVPAEISRLLSAFVGSYHAKEFVQNLFRYREQLHDLRASDFYAAWRSAQLSKRE